MRNGVLILALLGASVAAAQGPRVLPWTSPATGRAAVVTLYAAAGPSARTLVFLEHLAAPVGGSSEPAAAIQALRAAGNTVLTVDYAHDRQACSPGLNADFLALREQLPAWLGAASGPEVPAFILPAGDRLVSGVTYFAEGGHRFAMDVWLPPASSAGPVPCVVQFAHNNAERMAAHNFVRYKDTLIEGLATLGFAVAMADHPTPPPGVSTYQMPDVVFKARAALRTLRGQVVSAGLTAGKMGVIGFSRAGAVAALAAVADPTQVPAAAGSLADGSDRVDAAFCASGRYDLPALAATPNAEAGGALVAAWGDPREHADVWRDASAVHYITRQSPAFFLTVGADDQPFRVTQSRLLAQALAAAGVEQTLVVLPATPHALPSDPATLQAVAAFFERHLSGGR